MVGVLDVMPYISAALFLVGTAWRIRRWYFYERKTLGLYNVAIVPGVRSYASVLKEVLARMFLFKSLWRSNTDFACKKVRHVDFALAVTFFHWPIWILLFVGHLPRYWQVFGATVDFGWFNAVIDFVNGDFGTIIAIIAWISGLYLLLRRIFVYEVRYISYLDDYFAILLILTILTLGLYNRLIPTLWPAPELLRLMPVVSNIHMFLSMVLAAYFPYGKLFHLYVFPFVPTLVQKFPPPYTSMPRMPRVMSTSER